MSDKWQAGHYLMVSMMGPQFAAAVEGAANAGNFGNVVLGIALRPAPGDGTSLARAPGPGFIPLILVAVRRQAVQIVDVDPFPFVAFRLLAGRGF